MKMLYSIGVLGVIAMSLALFNGFINGSFFEDGSLLLSNPWGIVSLVDLYVGFILFSLWIVLRETHILSIILWVLAMMILGFFTGAIYLLYALYTSKGNYLTLILGKRKDALINRYGKS